MNISKKEDLDSDGDFFIFGDMSETSEDSSATSERISADLYRRELSQIAKKLQEIQESIIINTEQ